jgi:hypothetical protein
MRVREEEFSQNAVSSPEIQMERVNAGRGFSALVWLEYSVGLRGAVRQKTVIDSR